MAPDGVMNESAGCVYFCLCMRLCLRVIRPPAFISCLLRTVSQCHVLKWLQDISTARVFMWLPNSIRRAHRRPAWRSKGPYPIILSARGVTQVKPDEWLQQRNYALIHWWTQEPGASLSEVWNHCAFLVLFCLVLFPQVCQTLHCLGCTQIWGDAHACMVNMLHSCKRQR